MVGLGWVLLIIVIFIFPILLIIFIGFPWHLINRKIFINRNQLKLRKKIINISNTINILSNNHILIQYKKNIDNTNIEKQTTILNYLKNYLNDYCDVYLNIIIQDKIKMILNKNKIKILNVPQYITNLLKIINDEYISIKDISKFYEITFPNNINERIDALTIELTEMQTKILLANISPVENFAEIQMIKNKSELLLYKNKINELEEKYNKVIDELESVKEVG